MYVEFYIKVTYFKAVDVNNQQRPECNRWKYILHWIVFKNNRVFKKSTKELGVFPLAIPLYACRMLVVMMKCVVCYICILWYAYVYTPQVMCSWMLDKKNSLADLWNKSITAELCILLRNNESSELCDQSELLVVLFVRYAVQLL